MWGSSVPPCALVPQAREKGGRGGAQVCQTPGHGVAPLRTGRVGMNRQEVGMDGSGAASEPWGLSQLSVSWPSLGHPAGIGLLEFVFLQPWHEQWKWWWGQSPGQKGTQHGG